MKIGLNLLLWDATITDKHVEIMEKLVELGYDGVEFPVFSFDKAQSKRLRQHLDRLKLKCTITSCVPPEANPISPDAAIRRKAMAFMKKTMETVEILGAEVVAGPFTSPVGAFTGCPRTEDEWKWGIDMMKKVAEEAKKVGAVMALEALNRFETYFITTLADAAQFAKEVDHPNFKIMFDSFHANIEEENIPKAIKEVGEYIAHVHVSENHRGIPGTGHVRFADIFKALKEIKYDRWLTVEAFSSALPELAGATKIWRNMFDTNDNLAKTSLAFIKKQWEK